MKLRIFIILIILLNSFSLFSEDRKKSLYIGKIQTYNVSDSLEHQVRNTITLTLIRKFNDKYSVLDDELVKKLLERLKMQQLTGCSTEKCEKQLNDALNADYKIDGSINFESGKYSLTLKLYKLDDGTPSISNQVKKVFNSYQTEYYISELTTHLLNPSYSINDKNAPVEIDPGKVDLSKISMKEISGIDLQVLNFKSDDTIVDDLVKYSKETLSEADENFSKKKYESALKDYESILKGIDRLSNEKKIQAKPYRDAIVKRIDNCHSNIYISKISQIDESIKENSLVEQEKLSYFISEYEKIEYDYKAITKQLGISINPNIISALTERYEKLDISYLLFSEKKADSLYENYKFSESIKIYKSILEKLSKREKTKVFQEYSKKITKKIDVTQETGTSFITNRVKSYCELAEKKNFQLRLARDRGKTLDIIEKEESIQESLINARRTLEYSEFSNQELMDYYNSTVQRINSDKRTSLAKLLRKGDLKYKKEEITKWDAFNRSLLFPGFGQISEKPEKFKSSVIFFTAIPLATIGALSYINYYNQQKKYNSMTGTPFLMSAFFPDYAPVFIASDMNTFNSQRKKVDSSYSLMSASLGIYSLFYIYSLIDVLYFTDRTEVLGSLDPNNLHLVKLDKGGFNVSLNRIPADSTNSIFPSLENKYSIFYSYSW